MRKPLDTEHESVTIRIVKGTERSTEQSKEERNNGNTDNTGSFRPGDAYIDRHDRGAMPRKKQRLQHVRVNIPCHCCGVVFEAMRGHAIHCSVACRVRCHRKRIKERNTRNGGRNE